MGVVVQRARPWLGTLVEMRVEGLAEPVAVAAIQTAFAEVEAVHRCMSFHEPASDLSRLHAARVGSVVSIDSRTSEVLRCALHLAELSDGCFDPTIATRLVAQGMLPRPRSSSDPDPCASWQDIEVIGDNGVCLHRPLWLDLGGIAKGYAVDRAIEVLLRAGAEQVLVSAGGDLRIAGPREEIVHLRGAANAVAAGCIAIANAALASSAGAATRRRISAGWIGTHLHGRTLTSVGTFSATSVIAPRCMIADALTKIVFAAKPAVVRKIREQYAAQVVTHSLRHGWRHVGIAA